MSVLISLYAKRLLRQKLIYFFLFAFCFAAYAYSFLITTPEMYEMLNVDPATISGSRFPEFMIRFYSGTVGAVFMSIITALYINEELQSDMLSRPLLHGKTRLDIINAKVVTLCGTSFCMTAAVCVITFAISAAQWGTAVFDMPAFGNTLIKYILVAISLIVFEEGAILISLYARHTVITIAAVLGCAVLSVVFSQSAPQIAAIVSFDYYPYNWVLSEYEYMPIPLFSALAGIALAIVYGIIFYFLIRRRALRMDFAR